MTSDPQHETAPVAWTVRVLLYLAATIVLVLVGGMVGGTYGDAQCPGAGDDCPDAAIWSLLVAAGAVFAMVILVASCEITLHARRRRRAA